MKLTPAAPTDTATPPPAGSPDLASDLAPPARDLPLTVIDGRTNWTWGDFQELWRFRELFFFLTLRDIKLRYKQTILGVGWSVFQPLATVAVFVVFIGLMGKAAKDFDGSYVLFVIAGVLPWTYFANAVTNAGNSLVNNERLVTKTYFPRLALPAANVFAATFDFSICLVLFAVVSFGFQASGVPAAPEWWRLPLAAVIVALLAMLATGLGVLLAALIAAQRDFRFLLGFGMQLWMFATPCIYLPDSSIADTYKPHLAFNPAYGLIYNFRACTTPYGTLDWGMLGVGAGMAGLALAVGMVYFRRIDRTLADTI